MCCGPLNRRPRRWTVLRSSWFIGVAGLVLLCFYLYGSGYYGLGQPGLPGSHLDFNDGGSAPGLDSEDTNTGVPKTTTAIAVRTTTTTPPSSTMTTTKPGGAAATEPAVVLPQGTYVGTTILASSRFPKSIEAFHGVPYAQDTAGENRFRPPQPIPESTETFDAVTLGKICPAEGVVQRNMSENCLNANIYRPAGLVDRNGYAKAKDQGGKKRPQMPVVVYIHGGGFNTGHGTERNMASFVSWADAPMVAVNFNYRVGALGFLPSEVTAREGLLNLGMRDQQHLLGWVQDNIEAFGGDPKNVTVMGLSAGAHSIGHHIMYYSQSPEKAPFVRAILESGATTARAVFYPTHPRHLTQFREFLIAAGAAGITESDIIPHLRTLPLETIVRASRTVWDKHVDTVTWPFQPVIDGPNTFANSSRQTTTTNTTTTPPSPLIPTLPITSWHAGTHLRIPLITGFNTNEGTSFIPSLANSTSEFRSFFQTLIPSFTQSDLDALEQLYPDPVTYPSKSPYVKVPSGMGRQWARLDAAYSHYAYICPVLQTAHYMSRANGGEDVYVYRYAATAEHGTANHGDEAPVVAHDVEELAGLVGLRVVAGEMAGRWARFVTGSDGKGSGGGDGVGKVEWPAFVSPFGEDGSSDNGKKGTGKIMVFGEGNDERGGGKKKGVPAKVVEMTDQEKEACRFWWARVGLSEGLGRMETSQGAQGGGAGKGKTEARL